jgi:DNA replication protein DnaC
VLVLDDLGSEKASDWVSEKLFQVIGNRHDHAKRTIITSNLDLRALADHLGHPRTPSRIGELADVIDLSKMPNLRS